MSTWTVIGALLVAALVGITAGIMGLRLASQPAGYASGRVGEQVKTPGYRIEVRSVLTDQQGDEVFKPGTGREYYVLNIEITNTSNRPMALAPVVQTVLSDGAGARYEMAPTTLAAPFEAGPLEPGAVRRGELSYNVSAEAKDLSFDFVPGAGLKAAVVKLSK